MQSGNNNNEIGEVYSLVYTDVPQVFFIARLDASSATSNVTVVSDAAVVS
jgi:hypothetical protein